MIRTIFLTLSLVTSNLLVAQTREELVRGDRQKVEADGFWIYNDLPAAFEQAKREDKPIIVVLRCIPCHECVKLDDDLVDKDPVIRPLLEKFVRARQVSTNGLDLNLFQYDTDQSFAVFLLNADGTIYGRFGTRSHRTEWYGDVSLEGLAKAMQGALELHNNYANVKASLAGKRGAPMEVSAPEKFPRLKDKYTDKLNYQGDVVKSCIHCHQIGEAQRAWYRDQGKPIPEKVFYPFPHPKSIGLILDPAEKATVKSIQPGSPAEKAKLKAGDEIITLDGQPLLSFADVQWVLHNADADGDSIPMQVRRGDKVGMLTLNLEKGWRRASDISWRASTWSLRRMTTGGLVLEPLPPASRDELKIPDEQMALLVKHVGQYGPHAAGKRAGFKTGDVIVQYDGRTDLMDNTAVLFHGTNDRQVGDRVDVVVIRNGQRITLKLPMQE
jgi:hypothetical protein